MKIDINEVIKNIPEGVIERNFDIISELTRDEVTIQLCVASMVSFLFGGILKIEHSDMVDFLTQLTAHYKEVLLQSELKDCEIN